MREEAGWWLATARGDLQAARVLLNSGQHNLAAFHAQQAAEKGLKAVLAEAGRLFRGHACVDLLAELRSDGVAIPADLDSIARRLDLHYIQSRYPNGLGGDPTHYYDAGIAAEALGHAERLLEFAAARLEAGS
jgi:HEPN domain-containing protein